MKKILGVWSLILFLAGSLSWADTCPRIQDLHADHAPQGWTFLIPPSESSLEGYRFSSAIHSLNAYFYYLQVICRYDSCPSMFCPAFTLISNDTYELPNKNSPPWNHRSVLNRTLTCMPADHDPAHCQFQ